MIHQLEVKTLSPNAHLPTRSNDGDAGLDLYAAESVEVEPGCTAVVPTHIAVAIPYGYAGLIWPRSGLSAKEGIDVLAGVIDHQYRDEVKVVVSLNAMDRAYQVNAGDRIAQMLIQPVELPTVAWVDDLDNPSRGGFGSTGK